VIRVDHGRLRYFIALAFETVGMPPDDARTVAALMADADLQGSDGHGVMRLPQYIRRIRGGAINLKPDIRVMQERAATALIHGDNGMGHLVMKRAAELAIAKARTAGVAWVGAQWSNHAGPASLYARMPMQQGMIGLYFAVGNANHLPPWGGLDMLLSTNPISAAIPAGEEPPIVLDMATTVAAYGKVKAKAAKGEMMPEGWMIDREGNPLTDPRRAAEGFLLPIGGYKGYGLALIVDLFAGLLSGASYLTHVKSWTDEPESPQDLGHFFILVDAARLGSPRWLAERMADFGGIVHDTPLADPGRPVRLPGEIEMGHFERQRAGGIEIEPAVRARLEAYAQRSEGACGGPQYW